MFTTALDYFIIDYSDLLFNHPSSINRCSICASMFVLQDFTVYNEVHSILLSFYSLVIIKQHISLRLKQSVFVWLMEIFLVQFSIHSQLRCYNLLKYFILHYISRDNDTCNDFFLQINFDMYVGWSNSHDCKWLFNLLIKTQIQIYIHAWVTFHAYYLLTLLKHICKYDGWCFKTVKNHLICAKFHICTNKAQFNSNSWTLEK